jgi:hypothetical protein
MEIGIAISIAVKRTYGLHLWFNHTATRFVHDLDEPASQTAVVDLREPPADDCGRGSRGHIVDASEGSMVKR